MKRWWLIICFFAGMHTVSAVPDAPYDSSAIEVRSFNESALGEYRKQQQFQYDRLGRPALSVWDRFWIWFWSTVDRILSTPAGRYTLNTILVLLAVAVVVFFVLKLTGDRTRLFGSLTGKGLAYKVGEEDIHAISFEDAINEALASQNYRLAVRLVYLLSLKMLSDRQLIDWKPGKTNTAYVSEMRGHPAWHSFIHLTSEFEYAWYGGEAVSHEHFQEIGGAFEQFKTTVSQ